MRILIVDDDFFCRLALQEMLKAYGDCHMAANGIEAVEAVRTALHADAPYDLICLDIMMPDMDGHQALIDIRALEGTGGLASLEGAKIVMITAVSDSESIRASIRDRCDYFLVKPIRKEKLIAVLRAMALI